MEDAKPVDIDSTIVTMEAEQSSNGGLYIPGKDRVLFRRPEKSRLGLDTLALAKRGAAKVDGALKASKVVTPVAASLDEEEQSAITDVDHQDSTTINKGERQRSIRRYRDTSSTVSSHLETNVNRDTERNDRYTTNYSRSVSSEVALAMTGLMMLMPGAQEMVQEVKVGHLDTVENMTEMGRVTNCGVMKGMIEMAMTTKNGVVEDMIMTAVTTKSGNVVPSVEDMNGITVADDKQLGRKRSVYEGYRRTPGRSEWDDGRWEWKDTPHRDSRPNSSKWYQPSSSPMFVGAFPDARLVSPWQTPRSGFNYSAWDHVAPSPTPIRASGSNSWYWGRSNQHPLDDRHGLEDMVADRSSGDVEPNPEITESQKVYAWKWNTIQIVLVDEGMIEKKAVQHMMLTVHLFILVTIPHTRKKKWN